MPSTWRSYRYMHRDREPTVRKSSLSKVLWLSASFCALGKWLSPATVTSVTTTSLNVMAWEAAAREERGRQSLVFETGCPKKHYNTLAGFQRVCSVPPFQWRPHRLREGVPPCRRKAVSGACCCWQPLCISTIPPDFLQTLSHFTLRANTKLTGWYLGEKT